ncbi:hypothetical protein POM88_045455 [Heracleum sosnowskyi]|uniref:Uncharacterized protein n=1 Tax=Heracleum sosnowskyi TaxID=360622 RepID=A0AAD8H5Y4_9APIA|nr:hypothetical protein POM88_045455 [Heracleum sosnowskyi]
MNKNAGEQSRCFSITGNLRKLLKPEVVCEEEALVSITTSICSSIVLAVQEIWLTNTVFLKENNEKVNCLNSALLTKSISNLNRSSELMDTFEIIVSSTTCSETIAALKLKIDESLGSQPESWHAQKSFELKGIDDVTLKYNFQIVHARNFKNYHEKNYRRSELVSNLRKQVPSFAVS